MVYRPDIDERLCFVLMPFKQPFDNYYRQIIKPAAQSAGVEALRADDIFGNGVIITDIWERIWRARVVIADVTDKNANVNYELGLCHALGVPTILITRQIEDVPFDYRHRRCLTYDTNEVGWDLKLRDDLAKTLQVVLNSNENDGDLKWPYDTQRGEIGLGFSLISTENPRDLFVQGTCNVVKRIGRAFGPAGAQFSVSIGDREPMSYRQGYSIVAGMRVTHSLESRGIREMQLVAQEIRALVGDGTKTAILITQAMIEQGHELLRSGYLLSDLVQGMSKGVDRCVEFLKASAHPVKNVRLHQSASTAAMDPIIGSWISEGMNRVGKDGVISIENSDSIETSLEVVEGMELDSGFISDQFIPNAGLPIVLDNPYLLINERRISSMHALLPLLEQIARLNEPLVIIAEDIEGEALATLIVNKERGTLNAIAIRAPGVGDRRKATLDDIAVLTGAKLITPYTGIMLEHVRLSDLGRAKRVTITRDSTIIVEGGGQPNEIEGRIKLIRSQIETTHSPYDRAKLQERLARLVGALAVIRIGGMSEVELIDKRYRAESAMHSARSAIEEGWVPGGAITLWRASQLLKHLPGVGEQSVALLVVAQSLEKPIHHLIENAQVSPTLALNEIAKADKLTIGFNVETKKVEDLVEAGIIDSVKMLRLVLTVAYTHAKSVLQTEDWDMAAPQPPLAI